MKARTYTRLYQDFIRATKHGHLKAAQRIHRAAHLQAVVEAEIEARTMDRMYQKLIPELFG